MCHLIMSPRVMTPPGSSPQAPAQLLVSGQLRVDFRRVGLARLAPLFQPGRVLPESEWRKQPRAAASDHEQQQATASNQAELWGNNPPPRAPAPRPLLPPRSLPHRTWPKGGTPKD